MVILSQNKRGKKFFVGMSKIEYFEYIKPIKKGEIPDMCKEENIDKCIPCWQRRKKTIVNFYKYPEVFEVYVVVKKDLNDAFIADPTYPYNYRWNGNSPWEKFIPTIISDIKKISQINFSDYIVCLTIGDITESECDCIVNAANTSLRVGGGVCGAIFERAGYKELQAECDTLAPIKTGEAVITKGYNLKAKYIIHTAGPIYKGISSEKYLRASYLNSLKLADEMNLRSISFPSISTGIYGYPKEEASKIALDVILNYKAKNLKKVVLNFYDRETLEIYRKNFFIKYD